MTKSNRIKFRPIPLTKQEIATLVVLIFFILLLPILVFLTIEREKLARLPEIFQAYPTPTPTPTPGPGICFVNLKARLPGLPENQQTRYGVTISAKNTSWQQTFTLSADGTYANLSCDPLDPNTTYEFNLYASTPFLPKTISASAQGTLDFGIIPTGDLHPDQLWGDPYCEINSVDWSLMEDYFGQQGTIYGL